MPLVEMEARNHHVRQATGATLYGSDAGKWPAWWHDLVTVIEHQRILEHNARLRAEASEQRISR